MSPGFVRRAATRSGHVLFAVISVLFVRVCFRRHVKKAGLDRLPLIRTIGSSFANKVLSFQTRKFLLGVSDPMSITWAGTSDGLLGGHFGLCNMGLNRSNHRDYPHILLILFAGTLKRLGYINEVKAFCTSLSVTSKGRTKAIALRELGDIEHLRLLWFKQLVDPHRENAYLLPADVFKLRGDALCKSRFTPVAAEAVLNFYRQAQEADPAFVWLEYELARLYRDVGLLEQAFVHYQRASDQGAGEIPRLLARQIQFLVDGDKRAFRQDFPNLNGLEEARYAPKRVQLAAMADLPKGRYDVTPVWGEVSVDIDYRTAYGGEVVGVAKTISYPPLGYGHFTNLRRLGHPFSLIDEETLLTDTIHFHPPNYPMFNTHLLAHSDSQAVVMLREERQNPKLKNVTEPVILLGGGARLNYFHTIFEALGSLALIEAEDFFSDRRIVMSAGPPSWLRELMSRIGVINDLLILPSEDDSVSTYVFHDALQLACPSMMTVPNPLAIGFLRRRLCPNTSRPKCGKYLHLDRVGSRSINNERKREFHAYLRERGFEIVDPGTMSIRDQVELFKDVEILSAVGGAALSNLLFCPEGCKVIIVAPTAHVYEVWGVVTKTLNQTLWMCLEDPSAEYPNPYYMWCNVELEIDAGTFQVCLDEAIGT